MGTAIGRPAFDWTPEFEQAILNDIESGLTLKQVAEKNGISKALILKNVRASQRFCDLYARAMDIRTDSDFEHLADELSVEPERTRTGIDAAWVNWKRLQIDTIKWALSKRNPKKYAENTNLNVNVNVSRIICQDDTPQLPAPAQPLFDTPSEDPSIIDAEVMDNESV